MSDVRPGPAALAFAVDAALAASADSAVARREWAASFDPAHRVERPPRTTTTMELILWRHAEAEPGEPAQDRRLTAKGLRHAERVGAWLEHRLPDGARVLVSPARCAQQTAFALQRKFKTTEAVDPGASAAELLAAAGWPSAGKPVVVVGHQPTLGGVASLLLAGEEASWTVRKGALWWLTNRNRDGTPRVMLRAMLGPDIA